MTTIADRLFTELDRQLVEVRTTADGVATRAGILTSATALAAGLLGARFSVIASSGWTVTALVAFGLGALFGIAAVAPSMYVGMKSSRLTSWMNTTIGTTASDQTVAIFAEKIITLEKNLFLLTIIRLFFYVQAVAVMLAVVAALLATAAGAPGGPVGGP